MKGLPNACPTCLSPSTLSCRTASGAERPPHAARRRGEWPKILCTLPPRGADRVGAACPLCGHTNYLHPHHFANPALRACLVCQVERSLE